MIVFAVAVSDRQLRFGEFAEFRIERLGC